MVSNWRCLVAALAGAGAMALPCPVAAQPVIRLCHDDSPLYPWRTADGRGLDRSLLELAERRAGVRFIFKPLPWKRCLAEVGQGTHDGVAAASFKNERLALGVYPMAGDTPDDKRRMRTESYSLFRLKGSALRWDGRQLHDAYGAIGVPLGYSIADQLTTGGGLVEESPLPADILRKLLRGRLVGAALLTQEGDRLLRQPEFTGLLERAPAPPLAEKPYFLVFSKQFYAANEALAQKVWQAVAAARDSAEFRRLEVEPD